jgi:hypothetical protein
MPSIKAAASLPASTMDTVNILWSLAAGISCTSKEAEHQNKIHCEQLDFIKEKDARKMNKPRSGTPPVDASCSMQHQMTAIPQQKKFPCPNSASSTVIP